MDGDKFSERSLYTRLYYRLRLWAPTCASRAISAVAELLVPLVFIAIIAVNGIFEGFTSTEHTDNTDAIGLSVLPLF